MDIQVFSEFVSLYLGRGLILLVTAYSKNCFPSWVIDKIIHSYVFKKMNPSIGQMDSPNFGKTSTL